MKPLPSNTSSSPSVFEQYTALDQMIIEPQEEYSAKLSEIINEFPKTEQSDVMRILVKLETLAAQRSNGRSLADGRMTESEFIDVFYNTKQLPAHWVQDVMCVTRATTEEIIGKCPDRESFPKTEEGRVAYVRVLVQWQNREKLLGRITDAIQKKYGYSLSEGTAFSAGKMCYAIQIKSGIFRPEPVQTSKPNANSQEWDIHDPEKLQIAFDKHDEVNSVIGSICQIGEDLILSEAGDDLGYVQDMLNDAKKTLSENSDVLDGREGALLYGHVYEVQKLLDERTKTK